MISRISSTVLQPAAPPWPHGSLLACHLVGYGTMRFFLEYTREPDAHLGLLWLGFSMGQWLCLATVAAGLGLWLWRARRQFA